MDTVIFDNIILTSVVARTKEMTVTAVGNSVVVSQESAKEVKMKIAATAKQDTAVSSEVTATDTVAADTVAADETAVTGETAVEETAATDVITVDETGATGETSVDETAVSDEIVIDESNLKEGVAVDGAYMNPGMGKDSYVDPGYVGEINTETGMAVVKDPLLSSWPFVIGISVAVLFVSVALGAFLARRKIKKGIELYED